MGGMVNWIMNYILPNFGIYKFSSYFINRGMAFWAMNAAFCLAMQASWGLAHINGCIEM